MFPAGAGMNRREPRLIGFFVNVPRRRGDEPAEQAKRREAIACSPQARG